MQIVMIRNMKKMGMGGFKQFLIKIGCLSTGVSCRKGMMEKMEKNKPQITLNYSSFNSDKQNIRVEIQIHSSFLKYRMILHGNSAGNHRIIMYNY